MRVILFSSSERQAPLLVRALVDERLVACGNVFPGVRAIYRWQGRVEDETEAVVIAETSDELVERATTRLRALHDYDAPKILVLEAASSAAAYSTWLREQLQQE
ncbi:MAG: divalent-cation tolerance protein CutA [Myxococcales bacterium FL481]|nr:MAG: divalent-cation tolerance protein CutA [Myxococcales bacterium FL481]